MRKFRHFFLTTATLICSVAATWAQTTFENELGTLNFTVTDAENHFVSVAKGTNAPSGALDIPSEVTDPETGTPYTVTSIGGEAFYGNGSGLTKVTIPESVISIGYGAFGRCGNLTEVIFAENSQLTRIGAEAFSDCTGLTSVTIPNSVTELGSGTFYNCSGLTDVTFAENSVTSIGDNAFHGCTGLTSVTIPNSITNISSSAFHLVKNIIYNGTATGSPWGALTINGITDEDFIYADAEKTQLTAYIGRQQNVTIPNSVTIIGKNAFQGCSDLKSINIGNSVTEIGNDAFLGCRSLTSVTIPNSVTKLGSETFYNCSGLTDVTFAENSQLTSVGSYTFNNCSSLTSVTIPNSVTSIGKNAFSRCTGLTEIIIPNSVTSIGDNAFYQCSSLRYKEYDNAQYLGNNENQYVALIKAKSTDITSCEINSNCRVIYYSAFQNFSGLTEIRFAENALLTSIGSNAFSGCTGLTSVTIPNSVTSIGSNAFSGCTGLTSVTIPNSVTSIGSSAFSGCTGLTSITIPESVTTIDVEAFKGCSSLETVNFNAKNCTKMGVNYSAVFSGCTSVATITIGDNVETIPAYAFIGCTGLKTLTISASVTNISSNAFNNIKNIETLTFNTDAIGYQFNNNANLKTLNIGNSVTSISDYAFRNCTGLTSINIPEGVTSIGNYAFEGCTGIKSVTIPASVTSISDYAFKGCTGIETLTYNTDAIGARFCNNPMLKTVNIGKDVTKIGNYTFSGCTGLTTITIPSNVTSIGEYAFENCTGFTSIVVPNTVTSIGKCAFYGCSNLTKITLPFVGGKPYTAEDSEQNVFGYIFGFTPMNWNVLPSYTGSTTIQSKYIGDEVNGYYFYIPTGLREVVITGSSYIPPYAFNNCSMLTSITIPASVTSVGKQAFRYTGSDIIFEGATPPAFGESVFTNSSSYSNYPIYVPTEEAVVAYKAAENMQSDYYDYRNRVMVNPYCKITVAANNSDYGTVSGSGTYNRTTTPTITITATAAENCSFVCWAEDGATEATHEITLSGAATYTAIFKRTVTISNVEAEDKEYNGNAEAAISYDVDGLLNGDDVTVTATAAFADANAGEGKVVSYSFELSGNDADNYVFAEGSQSGTVTADITPILVSEPEIVLSATEFTYSGEAQTPTVTVKAGETVIAAAEYEVSFSDDVTTVGEKTVTVSNKAGNYTVNGSATYTINPAAEAPNKPEAAIETRCTNTEYVELPENWQWAENKALEVGDNTATAEYNGIDAGNYVVESVDITITRLACEHTGGVDILNALVQTCTAEGYTGDQRCKICGEIIATGDSIPADGHKADSVVFENVVEATRTAAGSYDSVVYCSVCKVELSRTTVEVPQILAQSIKLASKPNKVEYKQGEALDVKGGKITIGYTDKSTEDFEILAGWVSGFNSEKVGEQKLTVTFESVSSTLTTTFDVTVSKEDDNTAIDEDAANTVNIYAYQNVIVVENATDEIDIYNAMGALVCRDAARHVSTATGLGARTEIRMNTAGIYIVKVGNVAKRVMVNN